MPLKESIPPELEPTTVAVLRVTVGAATLFWLIAGAAGIRGMRHVAKVTNESILLGLISAMDQKFCYEAVPGMR
jgi:hypothetical protein